MNNIINVFLRSYEFKLVNINKLISLSAIHNSFENCKKINPNTKNQEVLILAKTGPILSGSSIYLGISSLSIVSDIEQWHGR